MSSPTTKIVVPKGQFTGRTMQVCGQSDEENIEVSPQTMKLLELKTLVCGECGRELTPKLDMMRGNIALENRLVQYWHTANIDCNKSEWVIEVELLQSTDEIRVIGKLDWKTLPAKLVPIE